MGDLISRKALLTVPNVRKVVEYDETGEYITYLAVPEDAIKNAPAVDAALVSHGRWKWFEEWLPSTTAHYAECEDCGWQCSECETALRDMIGGYWDNPDEKPKLNYCPNCGARMDMEVSGDV